MEQQGDGVGLFWGRAKNRSHSLISGELLEFKELGSSGVEEQNSDIQLRYSDESSVKDLDM